MVSRMPRSSGSSCAVKLNSLLLEAASEQHFGHVPMVQDRVSGEVLGDLAEAGLEAGFAAGAADARFGVADDAGGAIDHARFEQRPDGEIGGGRVTAGVGDAGARPGCARGRTPAGRRQPRRAVRARCEAPYTRRHSSRACAGGKRRSDRRPWRRRQAWRARVPWRRRAEWPGRRRPDPSARTASAVQGMERRGAAPRMRGDATGVLAMFHEDRGDLRGDGRECGRVPLHCSRDGRRCLRGTLIKYSSP